MSGLKNKDLEKLCQKIIGKHFLGVFPSDIYPTNYNKKNKFYIIFNLSRHFQPGSHFVAISKSEDKVLYFDSLGKKCSNIGILRFLTSLNQKVEYNTTKIQSNSSILCGFFCLGFLKAMKEKYTMKEYIKIFSTLLEKNDQIVIKFIVPLK